jgi:hypothetical protein
MTEEVYNIDLCLKMTQLIITVKNVVVLDLGLLNVFIIITTVKSFIVQYQLY